MQGVLPAQLPWFAVGPALGLLVVLLYAVANRPLGATGAYMQVVALVRRRNPLEGWRVLYFVGLIAGGGLYSVLQGGLGFRLSYGRLGELVPLAALIPVLFGAGVLMGYGARWSGGCTSGHGLCGNSILSPASLAATVTFMATAILVTLILSLVSGGAL